MSRLVRVYQGSLLLQEYAVDSPEEARELGSYLERVCPQREDIHIRVIGGDEGDES